MTAGLYNRTSPGAKGRYSPSIRTGLASRLPSQPAGRYTRSSRPKNIRALLIQKPWESTPPRCSSVTHDDTWTLNAIPRKMLPGTLP